MLYGDISKLSTGQYQGYLLNSKGWVAYEHTGADRIFVKDNLKRYAELMDEKITWKNPPGYGKTKSKGKYKRPNPPKGAIKIYDDVIEIRAMKGNPNESHFPNEPFKHPFNARTKVALYGCPDGTLRLIGDKPLWKWFEY